MDNLFSTKNFKSLIVRNQSQSKTNPRIFLFVLRVIYSRNSSSIVNWVKSGNIVQRNSILVYIQLNLFSKIKIIRYFIQRIKFCDRREKIYA